MSFSRGTNNSRSFVYVEEENLDNVISIFNKDIPIFVSGFHNNDTHTVIYIQTNYVDIIKAIENLSEKEFNKAIEKRRCCIIDENNPIALHGENHGNAFALIPEQEDMAEAIELADELVPVFIMNKPESKVISYSNNFLDKRRFVCLTSHLSITDTFDYLYTMDETEFERLSISTHCVPKTKPDTIEMLKSQQEKKIDEWVDSWVQEMVCSIVDCIKNKSIDVGQCVQVVEKETENGAKRVTDLLNDKVGVTNFCTERIDGRWWVVYYV